MGGNPHAHLASPSQILTSAALPTREARGLQEPFPLLRRPQLSPKGPHLAVAPKARAAVSTTTTPEKIRRCPGCLVRRRSMDYSCFAAFEGSSRLRHAPEGQPPLWGILSYDKLLLLLVRLPLTRHLLPHCALRCTVYYSPSSSSGGSMVQSRRRASSARYSAE
jgi:hypothetical protein